MTLWAGVSSVSPFYFGTNITHLARVGGDQAFSPGGFPTSPSTSHRDRHAPEWFLLVDRRVERERPAHHIGLQNREIFRRLERLQARIDGGIA
jgi:hypothetical protein